MDRDVVGLGQNVPRAGDSWSRTVIGPLLFAAIPRFLYLAAANPGVDSAYWALSTGLLQHGSLSIDGVKRVDLEPLYPLFLAACRLLGGDSPLFAQGCQIMLSALGAVLLYRLAVELTGAPLVGTIAAAFYGMYPLLIRAAVGRSEAALVIVLLIAFAWAFVSASTTVRAAGAGVCLGLVMLTRTMTLPLFLLAPGILLAERRPRAAAALALSAALIVSPHLIRTRLVSGGWLPTRSGLNLYIGNSASTAALFPLEDLDLLVSEATELVARERPDLVVDGSPQSGREMDALLTAHAISHMTEHPMKALGHKLMNVAYFFSPRLIPDNIAFANTVLTTSADGRVSVTNSRPRPRIEHLAFTVSYVPVFIGAVAGVFLRRARLRRDAILWSIVLTFVGVHAWYYPATRYSAPVAFVLLFYAAVAIDRWIADHTSLGSAAPEPARRAARGSIRVSQGE